MVKKNCNLECKSKELLLPASGSRGFNFAQMRQQSVAEQCKKLEEEGIDRKSLMPHLNFVRTSVPTKLEPSTSSLPLQALVQQPRGSKKQQPRVVLTSKDFEYKYDLQRLDTPDYYDRFMKVSLPDLIYLIL